MARPETTWDVVDQTNEVAVVSMEHIQVNPALLKAYTSLIEAAQKLGGGGVTEKYSTKVKVTILKTEEQLRDQLIIEQEEWDAMLQKYEAAMVSGGLCDSWEKRRVRSWADQEGLADPFDEEMAS